MVLIMQKSCVFFFKVLLKCLLSYNYFYFVNCYVIRRLEKSPFGKFLLFSSKIDKILFAYIFTYTYILLTSILQVHAILLFWTRKPTLSTFHQWFHVLNRLLIVLLNLLMTILFLRVKFTRGSQKF